MGLKKERGDAKMQTRENESLRFFERKKRFLPMAADTARRGVKRVPCTRFAVCLSDILM